MTSSNFKKWFSISFSFFVLFQNCYLHYIEDSKKVFENAQKDETLKLENEDFVKPLQPTEDFDKRYLLKEDSLDKELQAISSDFYNARNSKRAMLYFINSIATISTTLFATLSFMCPSLLRKIEVVENLKKRVSQERRQINTDWGYVDSKTRYLQKLTADVVVLKRSIEKMDELKKDIITLVDPTFLDDIVKIREETKVLIQKSNGSNTNIEALSKKKLQNRMWISASVLTSLQIISFGGFIRHLTIQNYYNKELAKPFFQRSTRVQWGKGLAERKIKLHHKGAIVLTVLNVALLGLQAVTTLITCAVLEKKVIKAENAGNNAINDLKIIRDKMNLLNSLTDGNYTVVWNELASNNFTDFVLEAIETAKSNEVMDSKTNQSIDNMMEFNENFNQTKAATGKIDYQQVESLTKKLIEGFLDGNHNLNCYRKKSKIVKIISDKCAKGHSTFDELWHLAKNMDQNNLKDCSTNKKYVTKKRVRKIIKLSMKQRGKEEICIRNNHLTKMIICEAYLKDESNLVKKARGLNQKDVEYFVSTCDLPEVDENLKNIICRLKANGESKEKIFVKYKKFNATSLNSSWESCQLTSRQKKNICSLRQSSLLLNDVMTIYRNYPPSKITKIYNSCGLTITPVIENMICLWYGKPQAKPMMETFKRRYGKAAVEKVISVKCGKGKRYILKRY